MKEIESFCFVFLWFGSELKISKAKVSWKDVCFFKEERGLGFRFLKEINIILCLKLIWRIILNRVFFWVKWI